MNSCSTAFSLLHSSRSTSTAFWNTFNFNLHKQLLCVLNHKFIFYLLSRTYGVLNFYSFSVSFYGKSYEFIFELSHKFLTQNGLISFSSKKSSLKKTSKVISSLTLLNISCISALLLRKTSLSKTFISWLFFQNITSKYYCGLFSSFSSKFLSTFISFQLSLKQQQKCLSFKKSLIYGIFSLIRTLFALSKHSYISGVSIACSGRWKKTPDARSKTLYCSYGVLHKQSVKNSLDFYSTVSKTIYGVCSVKTLVCYKIF